MSAIRFKLVHMRSFDCKEIEEFSITRELAEGERDHGLYRKLFKNKLVIAEDLL